MKYLSVCLCLTLSLLATPARAVDAVPFAGFSGLVLGSPGVPVADIPANSFVALFALASYGGPTRVGTFCEYEEIGELAASRASQKATFVVIVTLVRADGSSERVARYKMRLRDGEGEAARLRDFDVEPGDYLLFQFRRKGQIQLEPGQQFVLYAFAGAPDAT